MDLLIFGLATGISHFTYAVFGFGSTFLALPILILFWDIKIIIPALFILSLIITVPLLYLDRKHIELKQVMHVLMPALIGFPLGIFAFSKSSPEYLKRFLGILIIIWVSGAVFEKRKTRKEFVPKRKLALVCAFIAGIADGALASGGPLFAVSARSLVEHKKVFRATLLTIWLVTDILWLGNYIFILKKPLEPVINPVIASLPFIGIAFWFGNKLHNTLDQKRFFKLVTLLLFVAGIALVI